MAVSAVKRCASVNSLPPSYKGSSGVELRMRHRCVTCKHMISKHDARRYLDTPYMPKDTKSLMGELYQFKHRASCDVFYVLGFNYKNDPKQPQKWVLYDDAYWNQAQATKPGKACNETTHCKWTDEVHISTQVIYRVVLARERLFNDLYPPGDFKKRAAWNRERLQRDRR